MPKRHLTVQNKDNEVEQPQSSSSITRASSKRANTDEPITTKKAKIEEKHVDKENIPKRQTRQSNQSKEPVPERPPSPVPPVNIIEPVIIDAIGDSDDEEEEEDEIPVSIFNDNQDGEEYPANKQYLIYQKTGPNQEPFIISKTARYWSRKYCKVLNHVYPDAYGMHIHNDFSCYGELEVVENCLSDLTKAVFISQQNVLGQLSHVRKPTDKVNYILAFRRLEALTILLNYTDNIGGIDDGDRFYEIIRVIGACYVTIFRGLLPQVMFTEIKTIDENLVKKLTKISKQLPNFKQVLEQILTDGHMFLAIADVCSAYTNILQIVYRNWVFLMEKTSIDLNVKPKEINEKLWDALKHAVSIDKDQLDTGETETFDFMKELRSYKEQYGLGGDAHDISKWSRAERAVYSYGRINLLNAFWF